MPTNLEYFRKQAKALLKSAQSGDSAALARIQLHSPTFNPEGPRLHDAQLAIAREQGFTSWVRFRNAIQATSGDPDLVKALIDAATSDIRRAESILAAHPYLAEAGLHVALVLGDSKQVERTLRSQPDLAKVRGGPDDVEPLIYVCFSRYANRESNRAGALVETARAVLRYGGNPNAAFISEDLPDNPLPCLYAATGLNNNPELAAVLLEAGANPNDSESLYHSTEHSDLECLKLLLSHGAKPAGTNALKHMLDREDREGLRLLLDAGADPNETNARGETALHWAVWRGRSLAIISELLRHGASVDARREDGRTAYALAVQIGRSEIATALAAAGANTETSPLDRYLAGSLEKLPPDFGPDRIEERLLSDLTRSHRTTAVRALLDAGVSVSARGEMGATALHWACWKGYDDIVKLLLAHGASLNSEDEEFHGTPPGWFGHGVQNNTEDRGDYPAVARLLIEAGAIIPKPDLPTGHADVDAVLREHGLI